jgi:superfamily II DNA or RNA helicase
MKEPVRIVAGPVLAKVVSADRDAKLLINKELSYLVEGAAFQSGGWHGRMSFYDFAQDTFPAGFYYRVLKSLTNAGYRPLANRVPAPAPLGPERPKVDSFPDDPRYEYQYETAGKLVRHLQVVAKVATGGGKSRIARICYRRIGRPTLFLTTRGILMHQMKDSFIAMGERVGVIGDGTIKPNFGGMNVGMVQTLSQAIELQDPVTEFERYEKNRGAAELREIDELRTRLEQEGVDEAEVNAQCAALAGRLTVLRKNPTELAKLIVARVEKHNAKRRWWLDLLAKFEFLILEEAHEASGNGFFEVANACTRAFYRLALTATPNMKDSQEANLRLEACAGPVAITVSEKQLIDCGILAKPYFKFIHTAGTPEYREVRKVKSPTGQKTEREFTVKLYRSTPWPDAYEIGVTKNPLRNHSIVQEAARAAAHGLSVMVLVQQKAHGAILNTMFAERGVKSAYIFGEHNQPERQAAINALKDGRIQVLIGSTILDVGVDVPAVGMVIIASAGKAEVALRQRIGRGLRAKKAGPNVAFVVDFTDHLNNHLRDHARERRQIIETTPGFAEGIVPDFDYSIFAKGG